MRKYKWFAVLSTLLVFALMSAFNAMPDAVSASAFEGGCDQDGCVKPGYEFTFTCATGEVYMDAWGDYYFYDLLVVYSDGSDDYMYFEDAVTHFEFQVDKDKCVVKVDSIMDGPDGHMGIVDADPFDCGCDGAETCPLCPDCGPPRREMPYEEQRDLTNNYEDGIPALLIAKLSHVPCTACVNPAEWNNLSSTSVWGAYTAPFKGVLNWRVKGKEIEVFGVETVTPEGTWYVIKNDDRINIDSIVDIRWLDMDDNSISFNADGYYTVRNEYPCSLWPGPWFTWNINTQQHEFEYGFYADFNLASRLAEDGEYDNYNDAIAFVESQEFVPGVSVFP